MGYGCRSHSLPRTTHGRRRNLARPGDSAVSVLHYGAPHLSTFLTISSLSAADVHQRRSAHSPHYYATVAISRLSAADVHRRRSAHSPHYYVYTRFCVAHFHCDDICSITRSSLCAYPTAQVNVRLLLHLCCAYDFNFMFFNELLSH